MKPGFQKWVRSILDWPIYGNQILIYLNISIFYSYVFSVAGRNLTFSFQFSSYTTRQVFLNTLAMNIENQHSCCKFHFLSGFLFFFCHINMLKTPNMLMKKHVYWWIINGNLKVILLYVQAYLRSCQISVIKVLGNG